MTINHRYNEDDEDDEDDSTTVTTSSTLFLRTFLMRVSQFIGLTPARSLLLHFLLIGYPFRYGLLPMGILLPHNSDPCSILFTTCMTSLEIKDPSLQYGFGLHAIVFYELVGVLWLLLQFRPTAAIVTFHQVLLWTSLVTLGLFYLGVSWLFPLTDYMTTRIWMCYFTACVLSAWTVFTHPNLRWSGTVKWSIPANSIFYAAVIQLFMAIRGFQALLESNHAMEIHHQDDAISNSTRLTLVNTGLGHYFMLFHAVLLLRIRTFLQVSQLRFICLYQLVVQLILLFWIPSPQSSVWSLMLSISILIGYLNGFLWAGRAEGISRILSGEKED